MSRALGAIAVVFALTVLIAPVRAAEFPIGYLQLQRDHRYGSTRTYARYLTGALGRPYGGAQVAIDEVKFLGSALGMEFKLERHTVADAADAVARVRSYLERGVRFVLLDLPGAAVAELASASRDLPVVLMNLSARDDELRGLNCQRNLLHVIPSHAMAADALAQYLVARKWRDVLMLTGPMPDDRALAAAFERSARRMGLKIAAQRPFELSNDPRERERNNVRLLTAGVDYDVVYVADSDGEFARDVPFHTVLPRPVVGSEGLAGAAWHWAWERHGAPQLAGRFDKRAGRPMRDVDWAAWMAVKAVVEAVVRSRGGDFGQVSTYLLGSDIILDGFKGNRLNFRPWNGQLRQPMLLVTHNWVVDRAPLAGFLHPINNLDTLGVDERESQCKL